MTLVAVIAILLAALSVGAAGFLWKLHADARLRLSLVLAVTGTLAAFAAFWIGVVALFVILEQADIVRALGPGTLMALLVLDAIPIVNAAFLRWLRGRA